MTSETVGNVLFLICSPCEQANEPDFGIKLAARTQRGYYEHQIPAKQMDAWLMQHRACAGRTSPDHFKLAMRFQPDHDQKDLQTSVKLALVESHGG
jgi:hypothetical protein